MLYPSMFYAALSMDLFVLCVACLTVFVKCLVLLLNAMELFSVVGGSLLDRPCIIFQRVCVCLYVGSYLLL